LAANNDARECNFFWKTLKIVMGKKRMTNRCSCVNFIVTTEVAIYYYSSLFCCNERKIKQIKNFNTTVNIGTLKYIFYFVKPSENASVKLLLSAKFVNLQKYPNIFLIKSG
jgi:hypothetical protein